MSTPENSTSDRRAHRAQIGAALHALRAHAKAHMASCSSSAVFRYELSADDTTGTIYQPDGTIAASGTLAHWAELGKPIRGALIGLKYMKERAEQAYARGGRLALVRYRLGALDQTASLSIAGEVIDRAGMLKAAPQLWLSETAVDTLQAMAQSELQTLPGWAKLGHQLELDFYRALHGAERYGLVAAFDKERERGYRLGIFRRKIQDSLHPPCEQIEASTPC